MTRTRRRLSTAVVAALVTLTLGGCVLRGDPPDEAIPPALLASDLDILEAEAGKSLDGFSVSVWASVLVERDALSADDVREILRIVVENTHISNVDMISIIGLGDERETTNGYEHEVYLDLQPAADALGLDNRYRGGNGLLDVDWDEAVRMLEESR